MSGLVVDLFAGGGGASAGIHQALGRSPDVAINHSPKALAMHEANHPETTHLLGDVWSWSPLDVTGGRSVDLLWASPDCTHFSRAKSGVPRSSGRRSLANVVIDWARDARPSWVMVENVPEFVSWGPLLEDGTPCPHRRGQDFERWVNELRSLGYLVEWRTLYACDYGAPTTRARLFLIATLTGRIEWPDPTHGAGSRTIGPGDFTRFRPASEIIDWSIPRRSIFERSKPLVEATCRRIARGIERFVLDTGNPFLIHVGNGERPGQAPRIYDLARPLGTVVAQGIKQEVVEVVWLRKDYGGDRATGSHLADPIDTVTAKDHHTLTSVHMAGKHRAEVEAFFLRYLPDREPGSIADIRTRKLVPRELFRAQGFPDSYVIDPLVGGKPLGTTAQVSCAGNSVCPDVAAAIVRANIATGHARRVA